MRSGLRRCSRMRGFRGRAAAAADARLRRVDGRGARAARLGILRAAPAVPDGDDGREPDLRHAAVERAGQGRGAGRARAERRHGDAPRRAPRRRRGATSPTRTIPSAGSSTAPTISPSPSAACRCCSIWRWPGAYDMVDGGRPAGENWLSDFTATCYHQTCDAWSPSWNLRGAAQEAELFYAIGARLANSRAWPQWNPASEFAKVRAHVGARHAAARRQRANAAARCAARRRRQRVREAGGAILHGGVAGVRASAATAEQAPICADRPGKATLGLHGAGGALAGRNGACGLVAAEGGRRARHFARARRD